MTADAIERWKAREARMPEDEQRRYRFWAGLRLTLGDEVSLTSEQEAALGYLRLRCGVCKSCGAPWLWCGSTNDAGHPKMRSRRTGKHRPVRREVWEVISGRELRPDQLVTTRCGNSLCLNPALLEVTTKSEVSRRSNARADVALRRRVSLAATMRERHAKLNRSKVARIRRDPRMGRVIAAELGVSKGLISKVRRYEAWADIANPYAQLGARTA